MPFHTLTMLLSSNTSPYSPPDIISMNCSGFFLAEIDLWSFASIWVSSVLIFDLHWPLTEVDIAILHNVLLQELKIQLIFKTLIRVSYYFFISIAFALKKKSKSHGIFGLSVSRGKTDLMIANDHHRRRQPYGKDATVSSFPVEKDLQNK